MQGGMVIICSILKCLFLHDTDYLIYRHTAQTVSLNTCSGSTQWPAKGTPQHKGKFRTYLRLPWFHGRMTSNHERAIGKGPVLRRGVL